MTNKETGFNKIQELVNRFNEQYDSYKKSDYNETLTRRDFIDPFFKALGWDMDNENGYAESYREVIHEDKVKVGKATKAPDYSFRLAGGKRLFFVEAKKPSVYVKDEIQPAYQVRRYGWSAKLSISIITDFEEFAVYDCTKKPKLNDKASNARIKYLTFKEYITEFDFLWDTFSKECVLKGSFDKFVQSDTYKKGTATVDKEFLQSLDSWRTYLATSISSNNKNLDEDELNFVVQQIIDRIIFLRIAESRGVEPYESLLSCTNSGNYYKNIFQLFLEADDKYNSGLFDFKKDQLSKHLQIDNKVVRNIIEELYYPKSEYEFAYIPIEILGTAYEQFLGKTITMDKAHRAKIEEKPEVRKAGGVYYTPQYVVDYIVENTIGNLTNGKTPQEVSKLKIVDPACGSGSFLIGAYQYLLNWHLNYYTNNIAEAKKVKALTDTGTLTNQFKKQILLNNIYGVDIDTNAVEVTKLSLLLKCMEGETEASINQQMRLFKDRILPTLDENIKSGNSLIDTNFYDSQLDFGEEKKIKPFNWENAFPQVFNRKLPDNNPDFKRQFTKVKNLYEDAEKLLNKYLLEEPAVHYGTKTGFDVVIGNPPYVDYRLLSVEEQQYLKKYYYSAKTKEKYSLYIPFIELASNILNQDGLLGFIVPNTFLSTEMGLQLRQYLISNTSILEITDISKLKVFGNVGTYPVLLFFRNEYAKNQKIKIAYPQNIEEFNKNNFSFIEQNDIKSKDDYLISTSFNETSISFLNKLDEKSIPLSALCDKFVWGTSITGFKSFKCQKSEYDSLNEKQKMNYQKVLQTADIKRYHIDWQQEYIDISIYSQSVKTLFQNKEKIVIARLTKNIQATIDEQQHYLGKSSLIVTSKIEPKLLLALLNSKLLNYYFKSKFDNTHMAGGYLRFDIPYLSKLPIAKIISKEQRSEIEKLVSQLLQLNKEKSEAKLPFKIEQLQNKIDYCENRVNQIVYQLYELTDDEIKIVEGK